MSEADLELPKTMNVGQADQPLRIAVVYSRMPFPMMRGDQLTVAHLLGFLGARGHAVDLYTLDVQGELSAAQDAWLNANCKTVRIYPHSRFKMFLGAVRTFFGSLPIQVGIFRNEALASDLAKATGAGDFDIVYCYYVRSAPDIPVGRAAGAKRPASFLAMQLAQTLNMRRIYENERSPLKRLFYFLETRRFSRYEARVWQHFDRTMLIGPADVEMVKAVCRQEHQPEIDNWRYGAHGTDTDKYTAARPEEVVPGRVVMSGSMLYKPNVQAVSWFVRECWPAVRAAEPEAELIVQGRDPTPELQALHGRDGIVVTGTVADVGVYIRSAAVCINPMLAASGMQNKLIEYMACAKAVVATTVANEGIRAPGDTLRIADTAADFADAVIALLRDPAAAEAMGAKARDYVRAHWTWEQHFLTLEKDFIAALDSGGASG